MFQIGEDMISQLSREPQTGKDFVDYSDYLNKCVQVCEELSDVLAYTMEVYDLIEEYDIYVMEEDKEALKNVLGHLGMVNKYRIRSFIYLFLFFSENVRSLVNSKIENVDDLTKRFQVRLQKERELLYERAEEIRDEALQPWLIGKRYNLYL